MNCKLTQAWSVYQFDKPKKVMALVTEDGNIIKTTDSMDDDYLAPLAKAEKAFLSYEEAMEYYKSKIPVFNAEEMQNYIDWLYENNEKDKLHEILSPYMMDRIYGKKDNDEYYVACYRVERRISDAVKGVINIDGNSVRIDQVSHIRYGNDCIQLVLANGTKLKTRTAIEAYTVKGVFGDNASGYSYSSITRDPD